MRTFYRQHLTPLRWGIIAVFALSQVIVLAWLWDGMGGSLGRFNTGFEMAAVLADGHSLQHAADVRIDGVTIGQVRDIELTEDHLSQVSFHIEDESVLPMREGMTILPRVKSLLDDVYLEITPGDPDGAAIEEGHVLDVESSVARVRLDEILGDLDDEAMADAEVLLADLGGGLQGRAGELNDLATALGPLGDDGRQLFSVLVETQADLEGIIDDTAVLLDVLDERDRQLVSLVDDTERLAAATAGQDEAIIRTVEQLPGTIEQLQTSSASIDELSDELEPVARDLSAASPDLNQVLADLGPTSTELTDALPDVDAVLDELSPLLDTLPSASDQVLALLEPTPQVLSHANPSLRYLAPYAPDLASFFSTWGDTFTSRDANGHYSRLVLPTLSLETVTEQPVKTVRSNAYPAPGTLNSLEEFDGEFPIIQPDPIPGGATPEPDRPGTLERGPIDDALGGLRSAADPVFDARWQLGELLSLAPAGDGEDTDGEEPDELGADLAGTASPLTVDRAAWVAAAAALVAAAAWLLRTEFVRLHRHRRRVLSWEARGWKIVGR